MTDTATIVPLGEVALHDVDLQQRAELGSREHALLPGRLSVGQPVMFAISPELVPGDGALREYLRAEAASSTYYILNLVTSVRPGSGELFEELAVGVRLHGSDPDMPQPIAWSLSPTRGPSLAPVRNTVSLTVKAVIVEPKIEQQTEHSRQDDFVVAYGQRESRFEWRYRGSRRHPLDDTYQMQAVIKSPTGTDVYADIVVAATVQTARLPLKSRRYRAVLNPSLETVRGQGLPLPMTGEEQPENR
jgi:hypothetical protein